MARVPDAMEVPPVYGGKWANSVTGLRRLSVARELLPKRHKYPKGRMEKSGADKGWEGPAPCGPNEKAGHGPAFLS